MNGIIHEKKTNTLWKPGRLTRNALLLGTGMGLRAVCQVLVFLIIARVLGSEGYGAFSALLAVAGVWVNFSGFGVHRLLIRDVARNPDRFQHAWGLTLAALALGTFPMFLIYAACAYWLLPPMPAGLILGLGIGELVFWPFSQATISAYQGFERMGRSARFILVPVLFRLIAAALLLIIILWRPAADRLFLWAGLYAIASFLAALYAGYRTHHDFGKPIWPAFHTLRSYVSQGLPFSLWGGTHKLYLDADKFMLARLASLEIAGIYSAGYRLVDLSFLPLHSLLTAVMPHLFRAGEKGFSSALRAGLPLLIPSLIYASTVGAILSLAAPLVPHILGSAYMDTVKVVRWLAWLPLVCLPRLLFTQLLAASDAQATGMMIVLGGGFLNIALNMWLIPKFGWQGAVAATYAAEIAMLFFLLMAGWAGKFT